MLDLTEERHRACGSAAYDGGGPAVETPTSGRAAAHDRPVPVVAFVAEHEALIVGVAVRRSGGDG